MKHNFTLSLVIQISANPILPLFRKSKGIKDSVRSIQDIYIYDYCHISRRNAKQKTANNKTSISYSFENVDKFHSFSVNFSKVSKNGFCTFKVFIASANPPIPADSLKWSSKEWKVRKSMKEGGKKGKRKGKKKEGGKRKKKMVKERA